MKPFLSICIPTYNFGAFIGETVSSILQQMGADVEIVVLDGGSTDNTRQVVEALAGQSPEIKYFRQEARGGIDRDMATCVSLARGDYCWLFSADDIMCPGAMQLVRDEIKSGLDVYLFKHTMCTLDMRFIGVRPVMKTNIILECDWSDPEQRKSYFQNARTTEAFFSFLGTIVFRKSVWDAVPFAEAFDRSCWAHVARLFECKPMVRFVPEIVADRRGDNDSFADRGVVNRYRIGIEGYHALASRYFGQSSIEAFHIRRVVRWEFGLRQFLAAKVSSARDPHRESAAMLAQLLQQTFCDAPIRRLMIGAFFKMIPARPYAWVRHVARMVAHKNNSRSSR